MKKQNANRPQSDPNQAAHSVMKQVIARSESPAGMAIPKNSMMRKFPVAFVIVKSNGQFSFGVRTPRDFNHKKDGALLAAAQDAATYFFKQIFSEENLLRK